MSLAPMIHPDLQPILALMKSSQEHLLITGSAGTGKSTLLDVFRQQSIKKNVVFLAPTGVAALNIQGQTIHSFFNFHAGITIDQIRDSTIQPQDPQIYKTLHTIVIDEVSVMRADLTDCIDCFLRRYGPNIKQPFGGIRMIFVGDLYQLPPVLRTEERAVFETRYNTPYFLSALAFEQTELKVITLKKPYRQKEQFFIELLNRVRNNTVTAADIELLNSRYNATETLTAQQHIILTSTNKQADVINEDHLATLDTELHTSKADIDGRFQLTHSPTQSALSFKVGAQVMLLKNDQKRRWVNGSLGTIVSIEDKELVSIRLSDNNKVVYIAKAVWEMHAFALHEDNIIPDVVASFRQFPFRLAWAITIHKSQGKTFDQVIIDTGRGTFMPGQLYVALSRCRNFDGIFLKKSVRRHHIQSDPRLSQLCSTLTEQTF